MNFNEIEYDSQTKKVFIPNDEVRSVFLRAIRNDGWEEVIKAVDASEALLKATLEMNEKVVAQMIRNFYSIKNIKKLKIIILFFC